ncbi:MAG: RagB/SusD family nutrient uptake outer membrane protein, partial [Bacteroidota bacterium]
QKSIMPNCVLLENTKCSKISFSICTTNNYMFFFRRLFFSYVLLLFVFACNEEDIVPQHYTVANINLNNFAGTETDQTNDTRQLIYAELANNLTSVEYRMLQNLPSLAVGANAEIADEVLINRYQWEADNPVFQVVWERMYQGVSNLNQVVTHFSSRNYSEEGSLLVLEARVLRAMYYFELQLMFGNVPVFKENVNDVLTSSQTNEQLIWQLIFEDLEAGLQLGKSSDNRNFANFWAAKALLGKVYLYRASKGLADEWSLAFQQFNDIINSGHFILEKNYFNLFEPNLALGIENIWYTASDRVITQKSDIIRENPLSTPDSRFVTLIESSDTRKVAILEKDNTATWVFRKYNPKLVQTSIIPEYIFRLADIWLFHSEILNHLSATDRSRLTGINLVRARSGQNLLDNTIEETTFLELIQVEREKELVLEAKSLFDYRRWGLTFIKKQLPDFQIEEKHLLFPIPVAVLNDEAFAKWHLKQNKGY